MSSHMINENSRTAFIESIKTDKSRETVAKYERDLRKLQYFLDNALSDNKDYGIDMLEKYQKWLVAEGFRYRSVNSYVSAAYQLCLFLDINVKHPKSLHPDVKFVDNSNGLSSAEYQRLIKAAYKYDMEQVGILIQVISGTPLRIFTTQTTRAGLKLFFKMCKF